MLWLRLIDKAKSKILINSGQPLKVCHFKSVPARYIILGNPALKALFLTVNLVEQQKIYFHTRDLATEGAFCYCSGKLVAFGKVPTQLRLV